MTLLQRLFRSPRRMLTTEPIDLLSRPGCHLCEAALDALVSELGGGRVNVVDITTDRQLEDEYVFRIPVVLFRGEVVAEGVIGRQESRAVRRHIQRASSSARETS